VDPKGLNNKQVIEETEKVVTDGKGSVERLVKKEVNGETVLEETKAIQ
jgi:hypothetical protein